jgi:hypothetical protein
VTELTKPQSVEEKGVETVDAESMKPDASLVPVLTDECLMKYDRRRPLSAFEEGKISERIDEPGVSTSHVATKEVHDDKKVPDKTVWEE